MVDIKDSLPELNDPNFKRFTWMEKFDQPQDGIKFLMEVMTKRHYFKEKEKEKTINLQNMVLGIKDDDGFDKVTRYIFQYLTDNNQERSEREILLYMYLLSDEIKQGISEYPN